jgi:hypothetical protein
MTEKTVNRARVQRKPLHQQGPQSISGDKDPNFVYRFVNDTGSRIAKFKQAGYELVDDDSLIVGDARVSDASDLGSSKRVISNDGTVSYLMKIRKDWHEEDQKSKADLIKEQEAAMKQEATQGMYGKFDITRK